MHNSNGIPIYEAMLMQYSNELKCTDAEIHSFRAFFFLSCELGSDLCPSENLIRSQQCQDI